MKTEKLTTKQYEDLTHQSKLIIADSHGPKVLKLNNGNYLKLFRTKRLLSSAIIRPYAKRFRDNAKKLKQLDIKTITVTHYYKIPHIKRTAVEYEPIAGQELRKALETKSDKQLLTSFANFVSLLHNKGIYFRSIHLGNVILTPDNEWALIDIADLTFHNKPLSINQRLRNFKHMLKEPKDQTHLKQHNQVFLKTYIHNCKEQDHQKFQQLLQQTKK